MPTLFLLLLLFETNITIIFTVEDCDEKENEKKKKAVSPTYSKKKKASKGKKKKRERKSKNSFVATEVFKASLVYKIITIFVERKK